MTAPTDADLARMVAERVFGERVKNRGQLSAVIMPPDGGPWRLIPDFATDIAQAWRVVDRMRELGWEWRGYHSTTYSDCYFDCVASDQPGAEATAGTMPRAICLAALAALEAQP